MKAIKKPIEIECYQLTKENRNFIADWCDCLSWIQVAPDMRTRYFIDTLVGEVECAQGDYILKGVRGEFYPCRKDIFEESYITYDDAINDLGMNLK